MVRNGFIPDGDLGTIPGTGQRVLRALVPQTAALRDAFRARFGKPLVITDAYRDYDAQVRVKIAKGIYAATPGTSNHGWGRALDLGSGVNEEGSPEYRWMKANGPRFGWSHPRWAEDNNPANGQQEPWHWEAAETPVPVSNYIDAGGAVPNVPDIDPIDPIPEDDMTPDQERMLREVHAALGAGGAIGTADILTVLGRLADVQANINGQPGVNVAVQTSLAALTKAVEELAGVVYKGTGGTAVDDTVYQRVKRLDES